MMNLWSDTVEELIEDMSSNLGNVTTGYVTTATRDVTLDGVDVKKDAYIGLDQKHIKTAGADRMEVVKSLITKLMDADPKDVIIVFYGKDVPEEQVEELSAFLSQAYPMVDTGFVDGKQDVYDFVISLE